MIIHIDLDCFYAQVEELAEPSLKTKPLGIQQKQIVVTSNYEARRQGVGKLMLVEDALKICPFLVLRDGSDTSAYRRASRSIFKTVSLILAGDENVPIERLGLDELFIDVSRLIDAHMDSPTSVPWPDGSVLFELPGMTTAVAQMASNKDLPTVSGFSYDPQTPQGHAVGYHGDSLTATEKRLVIASHLSQQIRNILKACLGFTCSAGIAHNKLLAKWSGGLYKPDMQTVVFHECDSAMQSFFQLPVKRIPGVGNSTFNKLLGFVAHSLSCQQDESNNYSDVTIAELREIVSERDLVTLFNADGTGERIWRIISAAQDPSPVADSKSPLQISVEDAFGSCRDLEDAQKHINAISERVICRYLEEEAIDGVLGRFASTVRLAVRRKNPRASEQHTESNHSFDRETKSALIPVDFYATSSTLETQVSILADVCFHLLKSIISGDSSFLLKLIGITLTDFKSEKPSRSIKDYFANPRLETTNRKTLSNIDWDVFQHLPQDIQQELLATYNVPNPTKDASIGKNPPKKKRKSDQSTTLDKWFH